MIHRQISHHSFSVPFSNPVLVFFIRIQIKDKCSGDWSGPLDLILSVMISNQFSTCLPNVVSVFTDFHDIEGRKHWVVDFDSTQETSQDKVLLRKGRKGTRKLFGVGL